MANRIAIVQPYTVLPLGTLEEKFVLARLDTCTFATGSSGDITIASAHLLVAGSRVAFTSTGALPSAITSGTIYYVLSSGLTSTKIRISATVGGSLITFAGAGTGTHSAYGRIYEDIAAVTASTTLDTMNTVNNHFLRVGDRVQFTTTNTLPAPLAVATDYYVLSSGLTYTAVKLSTTSGGSAIDITTTGTGFHTMQGRHCETFFMSDQVIGLWQPGKYAIFPSDQFGNLPVWGTWAFSDGYVNLSYEFEWYMENVTFPVTYSVVAGALPPGLELVMVDAESRGRVFGIPTTIGIFGFTLRATNEEGYSDSGEFFIHIYDELDQGSSFLFGN